MGIKKNSLCFKALNEGFTVLTVASEKGNIVCIADTLGSIHCSVSGYLNTAV